MSMEISTILISIIVAMVVIAIPFIWQFIRMYGRLSLLQENEKTVFELAESVATMNVRAMSHFDDITDPNPTQCACMRIQTAISTIRPFLPQHVTDIPDNGAEESSEGSGTDDESDGFSYSARDNCDLFQPNPATPLNNIPSNSLSLGAPGIHPIVPVNERLAINLTEQNTFVLTVRLATYDSAKLLTFVNTTVKIVMSHCGVVHHYRDGTLIVTWARTAGTKRPHVRTLRAAVAISKALERENIATHIGVDVSPCKVGNVGAQDSLIFHELHGNAVNGSLALSEFCRFLDARVLMSEAVSRGCFSTVLFRHVAYMDTSVRTMSADTGALKVFEVIDLRASERCVRDDDMVLRSIDEDALIIDGIQRFESGVAMFCEGNYTEARNVFRQASEDNKNDRVSQQYVLLCESKVTST